MYGFPTGKKENEWFFTAIGPATSAASNLINQEFIVPQWASMLYIQAVAAGGGGGGGAGSADATIACGGAGGSGGTTAVGFFPVAVLPEKLYVRPGVGQAGGAGGTAGSGSSAGAATGVQDTIVTGGYETATGTVNILLYAAGAPGGGGGTATSGGASGGAVGAPAITTGVLLQHGLWTSHAGVQGQPGGNSGAVGTVCSILTVSHRSGGAGGGGVNASNVTTSGGGIIGTVSAGFFTFPTISGGAGTGEAGGDGYTILKPRVYTGGAGGGGNTGAASVGGKGGTAALGCGGGGGGGANGAGATGGAGGRGGDGYVVIIAI